MKRITLELDNETIERLESIGQNGRGSALSNEILGMALCDAYFQAKLDAKNKRKRRRNELRAMWKKTISGK